MANHAGLYTYSTTTWDRISKPSDVLPSPFRASMFEGWYCKDFFDDYGNRFQRRRRRGRNGMTERWFIMSEFKTEKQNPYLSDDPPGTEPLPPSAEESRVLGIRYVVDNMTWDLIEELDFAAKERVSLDTRKILYRVKKRVREARRILHELDRNLLKMPDGAEIAMTVQ